MRISKFVSTAFLVYLFAGPRAVAQQAPATTAAAPATGLLLARIVHQRDAQLLGGPSLVQYETLWVVLDASGAHIVATLPDIIVPRKTGFWRIGIQHTCQLMPPDKSDPASHGNISTADLAYAVSVEKMPALEVEYPLCDSETTKHMFDEAYNPEPSSSDAPADPNAPSECGWSNLWFESILPDLISVGSYLGQSEACEARGGHLLTEFWVQNPDFPISLFGGANQKIPFGKIFGAAGERAYAKAIAGSASGNDACADDSPSDNSPQTGWSLKHGQGEWYASAFFQPNGFCSASGNPKVLVLRTLTHASPLPIAWPALKKHLPDIADAYLAPGGSVLLVEQTQQEPNSRAVQVLSLSLYDFSGNKLGPKLLELPKSDVVMVEWSTGRFVQSWTDALTALQTHGLPTPTIRVRATPNQD
jgi:hypothetical protein